MKTRIITILCLLFPVLVQAEPAVDCPIVLPTDTNPSQPIAIWGADYQPCIYKQWFLRVPEEREFLEIDYTIDLNPLYANDYIAIYVYDSSQSQEVNILNYNYQPISGTIQVHAYGGYMRIVFLSLEGSYGELYRGFRLSWRYIDAESISQDQVFYTRVGIGIQPQERLHVNGAIRGDGQNGSLRIKTTSGSTEIGSASSNYSHFYTDRPAFFFNKPLCLANGTISSYQGRNLKLNTGSTGGITIDEYGKVGIGTSTPQTALHVNGNIRGNGELGALTIETESGTTTIGAQGWSYSHFNTSLPRFYFYKPVVVGNGEISSGSSSDLKLQTFNLTHLTIKRQNGYVGIGKSAPQYKLDVAGGIHADSILTNKLSTATFAANELLSDSLRTGVIKTGAIFVDSAYGADFVFDNNYQLRSLQDVYSYIQEHGHLPEIQSATDMQQNGVNMSEFQIQLLQKIEELTLYVIKQEQTIQELRTELETLK